MCTAIQILAGRIGSTGVIALCILFLVGCATAPIPDRTAAMSTDASPSERRAKIVDTARATLGSRYRYGGSTPREGFDCSGLVVYSYARAGIHGLPRSSAALERHATTVPLDALQPGDLLFFTLSGGKTSHVGIYEGGERFIHAPSSGKRVERVDFDHVYWGPRIARAGRLLP